jgi:hypothetical protein
MSSDACALVAVASRSASTAMSADLQIEVAGALVSEKHRALGGIVRQRGVKKL